MKQEVMIINAAEYGLEPKTANEIESAFLPKVKEKDGLLTIYNQLLTKEITDDVCKEARETRLKLVKVRTGIAAIHKSQKAYYLASGKFVDAWKNKETLPIAQAEEKLLEIEEFVENQRIKEAEELQEKRAALLKPYLEDAEERHLSGMDKDVWQAFFNVKKKDFEDRIEAERIVEENRIKKEKELILHNTRKDSILNVWSLTTEAEKTANFGLMTNEEWQITFDALIEKSKKAIEKQNRIKAQNEALRIKAKKAADKKEKEAKRRSDRIAELQPYLNFVMDLNILLDSTIKEYQIELVQIKKAWQDNEDLIQKRIEADQEKAEAEKDALDVLGEVSKKQSEKLQDIMQESKGPEEIKIGVEEMPAEETVKTILEDAPGNVSAIKALCDKLKSRNYTCSKGTLEDDPAFIGLENLGK